MTYNYHTHTYLCAHASGTPEEYVQRAIAKGVTHMGFSDHFPFVFSDGKESGFRVPVSQVETYFEILNGLKEKYKDVIDIKIGFEMEYYPHIFREMLEKAVSYGAEYLIAGQHFYAPENLPGTRSSYIPTDNPSDLKQYVDLLIGAIKTGVYTYIGHPDFINFIGDSDIYKEEMSRLCKVSKEYNVPLELNCYGIRDNRHYPNELFLSVAGDIGAPITMGFDSHDAFNAFDEKSAEIAKGLMERYNINYIGRPKIIKPTL